MTTKMSGIFIIQRQTINLKITAMTLIQRRPPLPIPNRSSRNQLKNKDILTEKLERFR